MISVANKSKNTINRNLCTWIAASSNVGYMVVEEELFQRFCSAIPGYKLPCIRTVKLKIAEIAGDIRLRVAALIEEADRTTICIDLWTAADGTHFVGIISHFYCKSMKKPIRLVIACKQITASATATNIATLVQKVWQLDFGHDLGAHRIANYNTDSGANLVKCCKSDLPQLFAICAANDSLKNDFRFEYNDCGL